MSSDVEHPEFPREDSRGNNHHLKGVSLPRAKKFRKVKNECNDWTHMGEKLPTQNGPIDVEKGEETIKIKKKRVKKKKKGGVGLHNNRQIDKKGRTKSPPARRKGKLKKNKAIVPQPAHRTCKFLEVAEKTDTGATKT